MSCTKLGNGSHLSDDTRQSVNFDENGRKYQGNNKGSKRVIRYQIDGYILNDSDDEKCDNAFLLPDEKKAYLIELKGSDLKKAADQIYTTLERLKNHLTNCNVHGRIVCSHIPKPDLRSTNLVRLERALASKKGNLIYKSKLLIEDI
jgi:hypothetical protein